MPRQTALSSLLQISAGQRIKVRQTPDAGTGEASKANSPSWKSKWGGHSRSSQCGCRTRYVRCTTRCSLHLGIVWCPLDLNITQQGRRILNWDFNLSLCSSSLLPSLPSHPGLPTVSPRTGQAHTSPASGPLDFPFPHSDGPFYLSLHGPHSFTSSRSLNEGYLIRTLSVITLYKITLLLHHYLSLPSAVFFIRALITTYDILSYICFFLFLIHLFHWNANLT